MLMLPKAVHLVLLLTAALQSSAQVTLVGDFLPVRAPAPSPSYDVNAYCYTSSSGFCYNKAYPASAYGPSKAQPPLNANDLKAMLAWRDANPAMTGFNDLPCTWKLARSAISNTSMVVCYERSSPQGPELRVLSLYLEGLYGLNFTGRQTSEFSWKETAGLSALQNVYASDVQFKGSLPKEWATLRNLTAVRFINTTFSGPIPTEWFGPGALPNLETLRLLSNNFSGELPALSEGALATLGELTLANNNFTGPIPQSYQALANITILALQNNQLTGSLPESWGSNTSFGQLSTLNLSRNSLEGTLPSSWGNPLAFSRNRFRQTYSGSQYLYYSKRSLSVWLERNPNLRGPIPEEWSQAGGATGDITESSYYSFPFMVAYVQPETGICGNVPPYVIALRNNVAPVGSANSANPNATIIRASLPVCPSGTSTAG